MSVFQKRKTNRKNPIENLSIFDIFFLSIGMVDIAVIIQAIAVSLQ